MALYDLIRWCIEHDLLSEDASAEVVVKALAVECLPYEAVPENLSDTLRQFRKKTTYARLRAVAAIPTVKVTTDAEPEPDKPAGEPAWQMGKHDWREAGACLICGLRRTMLFDRVEEGEYAYEVNGYMEPVPGPCVPRLPAPIEGLLTTKQAHTKMGIGYFEFIKRTQMRNIRPAAVVVRNNVYLWRWKHLEDLAMSDEAWFNRAGAMRALSVKETLPARRKGPGADDDMNYLMVSEDDDKGGYWWMIVLRGDEVRRGMGTVWMDTALDGLQAYMAERYKDLNR